MEQAPVFDEIYKKYLTDVSEIDLELISDRLGITVNEGEAVIPFYGVSHRVSGEAVKNPDGERPIHSVSVVLCQYLLLAPGQAPALSGEWVKYHSFPDAAPYAEGFKNTAERPISTAFSGKLSELEQACLTLGGEPAEAPFSCDLAMKFSVLPKVNVLLLFNDQDEDFPADCPHPAHCY